MEGVATARSGRFAALDRRAVNHDGLAREDHELGLTALHSPSDPEPSLALGADGRVAEMDGRPRAEFDVIDRMVADHGIDLAVAPEAMALGDRELAARVVDPSFPREEVARLVSGVTPAKLAAVVRLLRPVELQMAIGKMRVRRTPSIQAHVTNRLDDPLLVAADAATAVAFGFRELETTVPVLEDAPSNAVALLVGSQVAAPGALTQCSVEEAMELELGMRGLTTYAETVSLYGTEQVFVDGDDTPWSKAFLCSAYASRGLKMRVTSGGGAEVLMGEAEGRSMLYLEARCVSLARAIGAQGVQNGGIDGAGVVGSVPDGMREMLAENLMVMLRDLESCSGNDTQVSESDIRRTAHTVPLLLAGSDFLFSGFGSITRYDNMFGPSNFNGDDLDDYLVLQRDWGVDGGLRPASEEEVLAVRERAALAAQAVYRHLALADYDDEHVRAVVEAHGSKDVPVEDELAVLRAATAIQQAEVTALEVVAALAEEGFLEEAERVLAMIRERLKGDYLQTAAIFDEDMRVLSKVTDPNDYAGPGTGYVPTPARREQIAGVRQQLSVREVRAEQEPSADTLHLVEGPVAEVGNDPREVCIGLSPAVGRAIWTTLSGLTVREALREIEAGLEEEECVARLIRVRSTIDLGLVGLTAARLAGSGIAVGLQGKGTALIHRRDLVPLANLELYSTAPLIDREMYRTLGINAGRHAKGVVTVPAKNPYTEEAITARYHTRALALVAIERELCEPGAPPVELRRAA
ncbi:MAG: propanediol/glycerol family dehydratase large subunit [Actinobacteria bacterium]|nr:propanediol/glycerol family dehydratase large subunit [Actinomycetota bacterium]